MGDGESNRSVGVEQDFGGLEKQAAILIKKDIKN